MSSLRNRFWWLGALVGGLLVAAPAAAQDREWEAERDYDAWYDPTDWGDDYYDGDYGYYEDDWNDYDYNGYDYYDDDWYDYDYGTYYGTDYGYGSDDYGYDYGYYDNYDYNYWTDDWYEDEVDFEAWYE